MNELTFHVISILNHMKSHYHKIGATANDYVMAGTGSTRGMITIKIVSILDYINLNIFVMVWARNYNASLKLRKT